MSQFVRVVTHFCANEYNYCITVDPGCGHFEAYANRIRVANYNQYFTVDIWSTPDATILSYHNKTTQVTFCYF